MRFGVASAVTDIMFYSSFPLARAKVSRHACRFGRPRQVHRLIDDVLLVVLGEVADQDICVPQPVLEDPVVDDDANTEEVVPQKLGEGVRALAVAVARTYLPGEAPVGVVGQVLCSRCRRRPS